MGFLDQLSKTLTQGVDRAKFEAEKFQKTTRLQGEVNEFRRQMDGKLMELGQRAYDLQRAGQINVPSLAELATAVDQLRGALMAKEEELKLIQGDQWIDPAPTSAPSQAQNVPISYEAPETPPASTPPVGPTSPAASATPVQKACGSCGFQMPQTAMFCPNCGNRVA
ncbi:MAG: zinc ribbon domain-containing protein [Oscillochloris sp.]|nr:zinc ribbon domain-containing protein [Oscillochloris sp.]